MDLKKVWDKIELGDIIRCQGIKFTDGEPWEYIARIKGKTKTILTGEDIYTDEPYGKSDDWELKFHDFIKYDSVEILDD